MTNIDGQKQTQWCLVNQYKESEECKNIAQIYCWNNIMDNALATVDGMVEKSWLCPAKGQI